MAHSKGISVKELDTWDAEEIDEWQAYEQIETLAPIDSWWQNAQACYWNGLLHGAKKMKQADFMPTRRVAEKVQTPAQQLVIADMIFGSRIEKE